MAKFYMLNELSMQMLKRSGFDLPLQPITLSVLIIDDNGNQHFFDIPDNGKIESNVRGTAYLIADMEAKK